MNGNPRSPLAQSKQNAEKRLSPVVESDWEATDILADHLASDANLELALQAGLEFLLSQTQRPGALLCFPSRHAEKDLQFLSHLAPAAWVSDPETPTTPIQAKIQALMSGSEKKYSDPAQDLGIMLPLPSRKGVMGVLALAGETPSTQQHQWLEQAARVFGRVFLFHHSLDHRRSLAQGRAALQRVALALTTTLELDEILASTMEGIRQILNVEAGSLLLVDEPSGKLQFTKTLDGEPNWIHHISLYVGQGIAGECFQSGRPVLVNDVNHDQRFFKQVDELSGFETRSVLCVPLIAHGNTLGVLEVINKRESSFDAHDQELLSSMAASVANSIHNARLIQALTKANAELEAQRWELHRSQTTTQALFDALPTPIYIVARDYTVLAANRASSQSADQPISRLLGRPCYEVFYARDEVCPGCKAHLTLLDGHNVEWIDRQWDRGVQPEVWEKSSFPVQDHSQDRFQAIVFNRSITQQHRLEASLARTERLAAVGQLATGVSHEINNPLTAIIVNAQMLQRNLIPEDERQEALELIASAGERALRVVNGLADVSYQDVIELHPTDVNQTVLDATETIREHIQASGVEIKHQLASDLPMIAASHEHLVSLWFQLLISAAQALPEHRGIIQIQSRLATDTIVVTVLDRGEPISAARLPHVFEPFFNAGDNGRSAGIGLSACHRIVRQHGGQIHVTSSQEGGTAFEIFLPLLSDPNFRLS